MVFEIVNSMGVESSNALMSRVADKENVSKMTYFVLSGS